MTTVSRHRETETYTDACEKLAAKLEAVTKVSARYSPDRPKIVRLETDCARIDSLDWLRGQETGERLFWSSRDDGTASAAVGIADLVQSRQNRLRQSFDHIARRFGPESGLARYYGGLRFDPERETADHWREFASCRFVLPRFELTARGDSAQLACNLVLPDDIDRLDAILSEWRNLTAPGSAPEAALPACTDRRDWPERGTWLTAVAEAVDAFRPGTLEKVVLARESTFRFSHLLDPLHLLDLLRQASGGCFHFCFQPANGSAFLGASPERLYSRCGRDLHAEALAGTRPRGNTEAEDTRLGEKLLASRKEAREHAYVADAVRGGLLELCRSLSGSETPTLVKLARVQHLITRFEGTLEDSVTDAHLLERLHPTPAVGGVPTEAAREHIRELELFDRGWYAGPVGWIGSDAAEFAVGIRSALVGPDTLRLYSGAGIVAGSHPDKEWDEIENKIAGFLRILDIP